MKTKLLMVASALILAFTGIALTFAPGEIASFLGATPEGLIPLSLQLLGAAQIGWAMTNWMSRESVFGGIYGRPLVVGNLLHFFAGGTALLKSSAAGSPAIALIAGTVYGLLALGFVWVLFRNPLAARDNSELNRSGEP